VNLLERLIRLLEEALKHLRVPTILVIDEPSSLALRIVVGRAAIFTPSESLP
jgi:hypothetical protein